MVLFGRILAMVSNSTHAFDTYIPNSEKTSDPCISSARLWIDLYVLECKRNFFKKDSLLNITRLYYIINENQIVRKKLKKMLNGIKLSHQISIFIVDRRKNKTLLVFTTDSY